MNRKYPKSGALARLAHELQLAYVAAGAPPFRDVAYKTYQSPRNVSPSTAFRVLDGRYKTPPRWETVAVILVALGADPPRLERLKMLHAAAIVEHDAVRYGAKPTNTEPDADTPQKPAPATRPELLECETCGAAVFNMERHLAWHWTFEVQPRRTGLSAVRSGRQSEGAAG